jgi:acyl carrier protein
MLSRDEIVQEIRAGVARANAMRPPEMAIGDDEDSILFGEKGALDSLALVSLIVDVEEALSDRTRETVSLADERAMARFRNPFRTVGSFADYVEATLKAPAA